MDKKARDKNLLFGRGGRSLRPSPLPPSCEAAAANSASSVFFASASFSAISASVYPWSVRVSCRIKSFNRTFRLRSCSRISLLGFRTAPSGLDPEMAASGRAVDGRGLTKNLLVWMYPFVPEPLGVWSPIPLYIYGNSLGRVRSDEEKPSGRQREVKINLRVISLLYGNRANLWVGNGTFFCFFVFIFVL